jgi:hypothetical protein
MKATDDVEDSEDEAEDFPPIPPRPPRSKLYQDCGHREEVDCIVCGATATAAHHCSTCGYVAHAICGHPDGELGYGCPVICFRCKPPTAA